MSYVLETASADDMLVRAEGACVFDKRGRRYIDARSGVANMVLGYGRRDIADAMHRQALELPFLCTMRYERVAPVQVEYAAALVAACPPGLTRVRFAHTGSSAVEAAILMARSYHRCLGRRGRDVTVALRGSYHGTTLATMAASGQPMLHKAFGPMPEGFVHVPPPIPQGCPRCSSEGSCPCTADLFAAIEELGPDRVAAVIVEPVKSLSGVALPAHYLAELRMFCSHQDILLIYDEVFSGVGRMGPMFATSLSGVSPDILCLSKALTAGYAPLGAVVSSDGVYEVFNRDTRTYFAHASSTDGHPVACAAGLATMGAFESEHVLDRGRKMGEHLRRRLAERVAGAALAAEIRGSGGYVALYLRDGAGGCLPMAAKRYLQRRCEERGVLIDYTPDVVLLVPPLTTTEDECSTIADVVAEEIRDFDPDGVGTAPLRPPSLRGHR